MDRQPPCSIDHGASIASCCVAWLAVPFHVADVTVHALGVFSRLLAHHLDRGTLWQLDDRMIVGRSGVFISNYASRCHGLCLLVLNRETTYLLTYFIQGC